MCVIVFFFSFLCSSFAIFEDQVGKFDWRQQYVGCPRHVWFDYVKPSKSERIYLSTEADVLAALSPNTGSIVWRQVQESFRQAPAFLVRGKVLISVSNSSAVLRAWDRHSGMLQWESLLGTSPSNSFRQMDSSDARVFVLSDSELSAVSITSGQRLWLTSFSDKSEWLGFVRGSQSLTVIGGSSNSEISLVKVNVEDGVVTKKQEVPASWFSPARCVISGSNLACFDDSSIYVLDVSSDPAAVHVSELFGIRKLLPLKLDGYIGVNTFEETYIYRTNPTSAPQEILKLDKTDALAATSTTDGRNLIASFAEVNHVSVHDLVSGKLVFSAVIRESGRAPVSLLVFAVTGREFEFFTVGQDCRIDFIVAPESSHELFAEWTRHEALSTISEVQLVDLPLSEAQAGIESEFIANGNILESFLRRVSSQFYQLRRNTVDLMTHLMSGSAIMSMRSKSFASWMSAVRETIGRESHRDSVHMERDYFSLNKIIVVSTLRSTIFGLDNKDGRILWRLYTGRDAAPLTLSDGKLSVPIFVQRSTTLPTLPPHITAVFSNKVTSDGILVTLNPLNGEVIERRDLGFVIRRIELLPFVSGRSLQPLLIVDARNSVSLHPSVDVMFPPNSVVLFSSDHRGNLEGSALSKDMKLTSLWRSNLALTPQQEIVAIVPKPAKQRMHSAGRVLGDRSVLYKYNNPNLIAIAVLDSANSFLDIHLIDSISGQIIYSARQKKVSGPIHLIHCENWVLYTYWNEKGRRSEIAVLELYEGSELSDEHYFNSLTPVRRPMIVPISQAYIFPQGISAVGVTETEQGLSTRSVLIAMPFGGIYSISRRMLDARRPLEITSELVEEMLIPYRPELPIASEDFVNYNQSVFRIQGIKTTASDLESTSLVFAYGLDLFYTRITPSGTFDILKDDFDHLFISLVLLGLIFGSFICKKLGRGHMLKQAWQ